MLTPSWRWPGHQTHSFAAPQLSPKPRKGSHPAAFLSRTPMTCRCFPPHWNRSPAAMQLSPRPLTWLVYLLLPGTREKLQGGFLDLFNLFLLVVFGLFPDENSEKIAYNPFKKHLKPLKTLYAHIEIVVTFLVVKIFVFLVIARYRTMRFWRKLEEMLPFSLPDLSKPKFQTSNRRKTQKIRTKIFRKTGKN